MTGEEARSAGGTTPEGSCPPAPFLHFRFRDDEGRLRPALFRRPREVLEATRPEKVAGVLEAVDQAARVGLWAAGYLSYEAAPAFDSAMEVRGDARMPLAWFGLFEAPASAGKLAGFGSGGEIRTAGDLAGSTGGEAGEPRPPVRRPLLRPEAWTPTESPRRHRRQVRRIRRAIGRGDFYQVNHTLRLRASGESPEGPELVRLFRRLGSAQGTGYHALLHLGRFRVLSVSPELFFRRSRRAEGGWRVLCRPMKGTAPRGRWPEEDEERARRLAASPKERAENLMITDLVRNDLSRVARPGGVRVPALFRVERYPTVLQMTSDVEADVPEETGLTALFRALFPAGSVTGAPKIRAMRHIARAESAPREVYCGAVGLVEPGGDAVFNVAIRTLWTDVVEGTAEYGVGGGITWGSSPEAEAREAATKAAVLGEFRPPFRLLETLRLERGRAVRAERHLARMEASARHLGFEPPGEEARRRLRELSEARPDGVLRVRLLAAPDGSVEAETAAFPGPADGPRPVTLAERPVGREDIFLHHKTTHREVYESRRAERPDVFDVLLRNEEGELTEFTTGNLVAEIGDRLVTPPRNAGLLAGTFRAELLERGVVEEGRVTENDLERAGRIWLVNSLREWVPVRLVD